MSRTIPAPRSLTSRIYHELRIDILCCRLAPGQKIRIADLQERFSAALSAVREALARLSSEGLVVATDQRGFRVSEVSTADLADLLRTRRQIESLALRQAIELGDAYWEALVSTAYADLVREDQRVDENYGSDRDWIAAHEQFHRSLIAGCRSPWLIRLCEQFAERTQRYRYLSTYIAPHRDAPQEHRAIIQAVLSRDAERAVAVLDGHFTETARILMEATTHLDEDPTAVAA